MGKLSGFCKHQQCCLGKAYALVGTLLQRLRAMSTHAMQCMPAIGVFTLRDRLLRRHVLLVFGWLIQLDLCSQQDSEEVYWRLGSNRVVSLLS